VQQGTTALGSTFGLRPPALARLLVAEQDLELQVAPPVLINHVGDLAHHLDAGYPPALLADHPGELGVRVVGFQPQGYGSGLMSHPVCRQEK
jgi:hypothetical protein